MGRFIGIGVALLIGLAAVGYKFSVRGDERESVREQVMTYLQELPDYETHASLYNTWFDAHHDALFDKHYHMGGRRSRSWFDGEAYLDELFIAMGVDAAAAGCQAQAENIQTLGGELYFDE